MANYTIRTNRGQEAGLNFVYGREVAPESGQTKEQFLQGKCNVAVLDPMLYQFRRSQSVALDASVATIPEANQAAAQQQMEAVIVQNGGQVIHADELPDGTPVLPPEPPPEGL